MKVLLFILIGFACNCSAAEWMFKVSDNISDGIMQVIRVDKSFSVPVPTTEWVCLFSPTLKNEQEEVRSVTCIEQKSKLQVATFASCNTHSNNKSASPLQIHFKKKTSGRTYFLVEIHCSNQIEDPKPTSFRNNI